MNKIIEYGSVQAIPLYDCSAHNSSTWSRLFGVEHPVWGCIDIVFGTVINILYIPIISVMFTPEYFKMSCFKMMIFLGIVDMLALSVNSIITGYLAIQGAVFCTFPEFNYYTGMLVLGFWCCSCIVALLLVANRLMDLTRSNWSRIWFDGNKTCIMLVLPILYGVYFSLFTNPVGFNSKFYIWIFDPMIFENRSEEYRNIPHSINNVLIVAVTCALYTWLYVAIGEKLKLMSWSNRRQNLSFQILVQSAIICSINLVASIIFVVMNFVQLPIIIMMIAQKMWQIIHGIPVVIYLAMNKTIRNGFLKKFNIDVLTTASPSIAPQ